MDFGTFEPGTTSYTAEVAKSVTETTVTPTVNNSNASYVIKLGGVTDPDGVIALSVGSNVITIEVTAEDDNTTQTYTVTIIRAEPPIDGRHPQGPDTERRGLWHLRVGDDFILRPGGQQRDRRRR